MEPDKIVEIIGLVSAIYSTLIYVLPPDKAKKLTKWVEKFKPLKRILDILANTPGGLKIK